MCEEEVERVLEPMGRRAARAPTEVPIILATSKALKRRVSLLRDLGRTQLKTEFPEQQAKTARRASCGCRPCRRRWRRPTA